MIIFKTIVGLLLILLWLIFSAILIALVGAGILRICLKIFEWIEMMIYGRNR